MASSQKPLVDVKRCDEVKYIFAVRFYRQHLLFSNQIEFNNRNLTSCLGIFLIGMIAEILGVNYGFIFGEYIFLCIFQVNNLL